MSLGLHSCLFVDLSYEVQEALGKTPNIVEVFREAPDVPGPIFPL